MFSDRQYLVVSIRSVAGETIRVRADTLSKLLEPKGIKLFMLFKKIKFYSSKRREEIVKEVPYIYEYAFIEIPEGLCEGELRDLIREQDRSIKLIGVLNKNSDVSWIEKKMHDCSILDLTSLGRDCRVGELVQVVAGPFSGHTGTILNKFGKGGYVIKIEGLRLQISGHLIRGLDYGAADDDINSFDEYVR